MKLNANLLIQPFGAWGRVFKSQEDGTAEPRFGAITGAILKAQAEGRLTQQMMLVYADALEESGWPRSAQYRREQAKQLPVAI